MSARTRVRDRLRRLVHGMAAGAPGRLASGWVRLEPAVAVLVYHRVLPRRPVDPWSLVVTEARFREQLAVVGRLYPVMPLGKALEDLSQGALPSRHVVSITFDDGYRDVRTRALPILEELRLPATLFLATGPAGGTKPFWWDRLAGSTATEACDSHRRAKGMGPEERDRWIDDQVREEPIFTQDDLPLSFEEARALPEHLAVGGHGHRHVSLGLASPADVVADIAACAATLRRELPAHVPLFAYPFGAEEDWSPGAEEALRGAGFVAAFTTRHGVVRRGAPPFRLSRIRVGDETAGALAARLLRTFAARRR
jgi:peptidoglycan/xylan/chitin deacetylase (PgdA/CDA1 family)